jgi:uncharacterized protein (DUF2164 family)
MNDSLNNDDLKALGFEVSDTMPGDVSLEGVDFDNSGQGDGDLSQVFGPADIDLTKTPEPDTTSSEPAPADSTPAAEPTPDSSLNNEPQSQDISDEEIESVVLDFLSERLGRSISSLEELTATSSEAQREIDERVKVIADFVEKTGRSPEDWFRYQTLNPSDMDDMSAVRLKMANEYPNLSSEEVSLLVNSQYKLDDDMYSEDEVRLSKLRLKIDADKARNEIESVRSSYLMPKPKEQSQEASYESPFDDSWRSQLYREVDEFESIEFELGQDKAFKFGINDTYKNELKQKNGNLETFFDQYVNEKGDWNYEMLNAHRTVLDNIDEIVKNVYNQGMSDGQRKLVEKAANVDAGSPNPVNVPANDAVLEQLRNALGQSDNILKFRV